MFYVTYNNLNSVIYCILNIIRSSFISFFILSFSFTVAPSTKGGCFSGGRGKNLITMLLTKNFYNAKLEYMKNQKLCTFQSTFNSRQRGG